MIIFWSDEHTSVFGGMSVRIANTKSTFGAIIIILKTVLKEIQLCFIFGAKPRYCVTFLETLKTMDSTKFPEQCFPTR